MRVGREGRPDLTAVTVTPRVGALCTNRASGEGVGAHAH